MKIWGLYEAERKFAIKKSTVSDTVERTVILKVKAPFGSISNMTNPYGICSYCRIDPQTPCDTVSVQSANGRTFLPIAYINSALTAIGKSAVKEREFSKMKNHSKKFNVLVSEAEWKRTQELVDKEFAKLARMGLVDDSEFDFDYDERRHAEEEMQKYISSRLPYVD